MKTVLFNNRKISFSFQVKLGYDEDTQELKIENYKADGEHKTWLTNKLLKLIMTMLFKKKLGGTSKFLLTPKLNEMLDQLNEKLENIIEVKKGIRLFGAINSFKIIDLYFKETGLIALVSLKGDLAAEVSEIELPD